jgi:hypothetical protein
MNKIRREWFDEIKNLDTESERELHQAHNQLVRGLCKVRIYRALGFGYAIEIIGSAPTGVLYDSFWMAAKDTKKEAMALCKVMGWRVTNV